MKKVTKEAVEGVINKIFYNNPKGSENPVDVLIHSLIEEFKLQNELSQKETTQLGEFIFINPDVMKAVRRIGKGT